MTKSPMPDTHLTSLSQDPDWALSRTEFLDVLQRKQGRIHFVGIGGVGMAGLARHLQAAGFTISGSDNAASGITAWLGEHGIDVVNGHAAENVREDVLCVVRTPAVPDSNAELIRARSRSLPVVTRGVALPAYLEAFESIAVCGTHGKTTTAAMIAHILGSAGVSRAYCVGGEVATLDGVARTGPGPVVVEADESDGTVGLYQPSVGVITNIEFDHMEHFDSEEVFSASFQRFASRARDCLIFCGADPRAAEASAAARNRKSFGLHETFDFSGKIVDRAPWTSRFELRVPDEEYAEITLRLPGDYNVLNAVAAAAGAHTSGVSTGEIVRGLESFTGVRRRFERIPDTGEVVVISDYAHHPTELRAVISAAGRLDYRRLHAIFQPHRFTRTRALLQQFSQAFQGVDHLIVAPVYAASELPLAGGTSQDLVAAFTERQLPVPHLASSLEEAWRLMKENLRTDDVLLILGAGDVEKIASLARSAYSVN